MLEPRYPENPPESDIQLDGFSHFNWKTSEAREKWDDLYDEMRNAKWLAEWRSMLDEDTDRKIAIIHITNTNRERWLERIGEYGLHYRPIRHTQSYEGFAHEHVATSPTDPERLTYSVIGKSEGVVEWALDAEMKSGPKKHDTVGELLGFPACCREFFNEVWLDEGRIDPIYEMACNTEGAEHVDEETVRVPDGNAGANVMWRYFGLSFLTHMPCSFDCAESVELARERYRIMAEHGYQEAADALSEWLSEPMEWSGYHRIAEVRNRYVTAASRTDNYWERRNVIWKREHEPTYTG